jgi:DNA-binding transcriptional regulator GbsR (MarR family)
MNQPEPAKECRMSQFTSEKQRLTDSEFSQSEHEIDPQESHEQPSAPKMPEMEDLAEQIGEFIHYWGFKRVHGRIWTNLYLAKKPLDAADLVRQMKISKALVSISLRELLEYEVIEEVGKSPKGTHLYRTNPDILKVILSVLRQREKRIIARIQAAQSSLERTSVSDREANGMSDESLKMLGELIGKASIGLESFIAFKSVDFGEWRKSFLTADLAAEAELRAKSIAPIGGLKKTIGSVKSEAMQSSTGKIEMSQVTEAPKQVADSAPVLTSGKGIGFRIY